MSPNKTNELNSGLDPLLSFCFTAKDILPLRSTSLSPMYTFYQSLYHLPD